MDETQERFMPRAVSKTNGQVNALTKPHKLDLNFQERTENTQSCLETNREDYRPLSVEGRSFLSGRTSRTEVSRRIRKECSPLKLDNDTLECVYARRRCAFYSIANA